MRVGLFVLRHNHSRSLWQAELFFSSFERTKTRQYYSVNIFATKLQQFTAIGFILGWWITPTTIHSSHETLT